MRQYFRMVIYFFLELASSFLNFLCSFFGYYPSVQWGVSLLVFMEEKRIYSEKEARMVIRQEKTQEANALREKAKTNGQNP